MAPANAASLVQLSLSRVDYYGCRIGSSVLEGSPLFFSRSFVERNDAAIRPTAYVHYQQIPFDHRRCCNSPDGHFDFVLRPEILIPEDLPFGSSAKASLSAPMTRVGPVVGESKHGRAYAAQEKKGMCGGEYRRISGDREVTVRMLPKLRGMFCRSERRRQERRFSN